jgi:hypothetical protein
MTHIAIQETLDGKVVEWMEKLTASAEQFDRVNAINLRGLTGGTLRSDAAESRGHLLAAGPQIIR